MVSVVVTPAGPATPVSGQTDTTSGPNLIWEYQTKALAELGRVPDAVDVVRLAGYDVAGDGGEALYRRADSEPAHLARFQSADGAWWELAAQPINLAMFGLRTTDDAADTTYAAQNTDALANAIAYLRTFAVSANSQIRASNKARLRIGAGTFVFSSSAANTIDFRGFELVGEGYAATTLILPSDFTGAFLDFGAFTTAPTSLFPDAGGDWHVSDLSIIKPSTYTVATYAGSRTGHALRDNGSGGGRAVRVRLGGFQYGLNCVFGSDFVSTTDLKAEYCDVGLYAGPVCQQQEHRGFHAFLCREGTVLDRPSHFVMYKPIFNSSGLSNLTIEMSSAVNNTRQLTGFTVAGGGVTQQSTIVIDAPWFEAAAAGSDNEVPTHHVTFDIDYASETYRDVLIRNAYIVSGVGSTAHTTSFMGSTGVTVPQRIIIDEPVFRGTLDYWIYGVFDNLLLRNRRVSNGSTAPADSNVQQGVTFRILDDFGQKQLIGTMPINQEFANRSDDDGIRVRYKTSGVLGWAFKTVSAGASYIQRMGIDVQNRILYFGDPEDPANAPAISRGTAAPTTGTWSAGSKRFNTAVSRSSPALEWICTAGGTPGTWGIGTYKAGKDTTANRPTLTANDTGVMYFDITLDADGKPIWWTGTAWVDATGATV